VPFYPICIRTYIDDGQVSTRLIRIFHGGADDWLPVAACRQYVDRLRQAGKDIQLTEYAGAQHGFDNPTAPPTLHLPNVQAGPDCRLEERAGGQMVFRATGQPFAAGHPRVRRGATIGHDPQAHRLALDAVKASSRRRSRWRPEGTHRVRWLVPALSSACPPATFRLR
jgi:dienelactone hydrolase